MDTSGTNLTSKHISGATRILIRDIFWHLWTPQRHLRDTS